MNKELFTLIVSGASGLIGYTLREWQNHLRPFITLQGFGGDYFNGTCEVELNEEIVKKTETSFYISNLNLITDLEEVSESKGECANIKHDAATIMQICDDIKKIIKNKESDRALFKAIRRLFLLGDITFYLLGLLLKKRIELPDLTEQDVSVFSLSESTHDGGCFVISYIDEPFTIGANFDGDKFLKEAFSPLVNLIKSGNREGILYLSEKLKEEFHSELNIAELILPELEKIVNENSEWAAHIYIANLKKTPILIDREAVLNVKNSTGASYTEDCFLVIHETDDDGNERKRLLDSPMIIPSGQNTIFSFFTKKTQKKMDRGTDFRNTFNQGQAKGWVSLSMRGVGLIKKRKYKTSKLTFKES